ncbi:MAG: exosortase/archaeosortase family protein [Chthoniobacter sp.]|nr:exosortase/archaeosortase family protein [Chthoniobacter sp.]
MPTEPPAPKPEPVPPLEFGDMCSLFGKWCRANVASAVLLASSFGLLVYFYGYYYAFHNGTQSTALWASLAWNSENNQEHSWFVLPISIGLLWYHREKIREARKEPSNLGLVWLLFGVATFVAGVRMIDARTAVISFPIIIYGWVLFLWGREVARVFVFPCIFLLFMVPVGALLHNTVFLQLLVADTVKFLASLIGVGVEQIGTSLRASDGKFNFDIAEGCSGIRSLMAMITLSTLYVHFTQRETWKQWVIIAGSVVFAVIGNVGRIFSVVLVARFIDEGFAAGRYHDYSGLVVFFPSAVGAMLGFAKLLNTDWRAVAKEAVKPERAAVGRKTGGPISYDY